VTVSIGVTSTLPSANVQPETILVAADRAMYVAKNEGKNQVAYSTAVGTGVYQALCLPSGHTARIS
jgi:predicted signal transduction protein with EAL and GGDEF domain